MQIARRVSEVAQVRGLPMAQIALAWILSKPVVTAPLSAQPGRITWMMRSQPSLQLTPDEIRHLEEAYQLHPVLGYS